MKAYKVFNNDWTCNGFQYGVEKEYEFEGEIEMCKTGFHACEKLIDCFKYYPCVQWNKIAEVELTGKILSHGDDSKNALIRLELLKK